MEWWHTIELPDGTVTPDRVDYRGEAGKCFLLPDDLTGKRVLDFGTYDGFWAIEAKKRGARFVMASDRFPQMLETARLALRAYDISYCVGDLDFPIVNPGEFDVVLFYGILYHLKNPFMGLWNAANCCKPGGLVIVETAVNQGKLAGLDPSIPLLWVIDELHHGDPTNYYVPNEAAVAQLCKMAGLQPLEAVQGHPGYPRHTLKCQKGAL